jgi:protein involved in polysaccharide export with SLBB domain
MSHKAKLLINMPNTLKSVTRACIFPLIALVMLSAQAQQTNIADLVGNNGSTNTNSLNSANVGPNDLGLVNKGMNASNGCTLLSGGDNCKPNPLLDTSSEKTNDRAGSHDTDANDKSQLVKDFDTNATEFQRFVTETTGRRLPLFGYTLFNRSNIFAPAQDVPVPADYVLGPGDEITARVWGSIDSQIRATIDRNGQINIPKVGTFTLAGVKASDLDSVLKAQIGRVFTNFNLSSTLGKLRSIQIYVVGQTKQPGVYTVSSNATLVSALFASGGPAANGSMRNIQLKRDGKVMATMDLYAFITQGDKSQDMRLLPGDVIVIPPAGPRIAIFGALDVPGIYELQSRNETLKQVLSYAGGTAVMTTPHKVLLERIFAEQTKAPRFVEERALDERGMASTLQDGDLITLLKITPQFSNAVTLRGNVASPLRYSYKPGMTLLDLLPEKEALLTPEYFLRKNALVEYETRRDPVPSQVEDNPKKTDNKRDSNSAEQPVASSRKPDNKRLDNKRGVNFDQVSENVKNLVDEPNWEYAIIERMNANDLKVQIIPFNLGELVLKKNPKENLALQPGDIVTIFSRKDIRTPINKITSLVRVEGEVNAPGIYQIEPGETLRHLLSRVGGLTPQAYLYGSVFTREETRKDQEKNLEIVINKLEKNINDQLATTVSNISSGSDAGAFAAVLERQSKVQIAQLRSMKPNGRIAMELQPSIKNYQDLPDLPLEDGDAIMVPPRPGYITAVGAVDNSNAIIWRAGRTVADTLRAVGVQSAAEKNEIFVLRADGSVAKSGDGWFSSSIDALPLMPGDTVVVPEKLDKRSALTQLVTGLKDWTQILSQFGLGAAAIKVLR